ncbi:hypothetical protein L3i23_11310 [Herbiconiux sp. L3-i23]|nr:hypothetical protein L3i23_11310 [Herbiconiux sp. L3-i23]
MGGCGTASAQLSHGIPPEDRRNPLTRPTSAVLTLEGMDDDAASNRCPQCDRELEVLPVASDHHLAMEVSCPEHGAVAVLEPF